MRVFLEPTGLYSRAMVRVANALTRYAPAFVYVTNRESDADLVIFHVIGNAISAVRRAIEGGQRYVIIQYCVNPCLEEVDCHFLWHNAHLVWSYYDLSPFAQVDGFRFYHSPLGVDDVFRRSNVQTFRENLILTSGTVTGPRAEAIEEVWIAAERANVQAIHIGPKRIDGMTRFPRSWSAETVQTGLSDEQLAKLYRRACFVSGLRHVEGFELPAAEGLCCGARPICFDQPAMRKWYSNHALYVEDRSGEELIEDLVRIFLSPVSLPDFDEVDKALEIFNWQTICEGFWSRVLQTEEVAA